MTPMYTTVLRTERTVQCPHCGHAFKGLAVGTAEGRGQLAQDTAGVRLRDDIANTVLLPCPSCGMYNREGARQRRRTLFWMWLFALAAVVLVGFGIVYIRTAPRSSFTMPLVLTAAHAVLFLWFLRGLNYNAPALVRPRQSINHVYGQHGNGVLWLVLLFVMVSLLAAIVASADVGQLSLFSRAGLMSSGFFALNILLILLMRWISSRKIAPGQN